MGVPFLKRRGEAAEKNEMKQKLRLLKLQKVNSLMGETFHQERKLSTYRLYTYKGHVCRGSAEGYPIHLQREPSRDCEESVKKNDQKSVVNFRTVYFLCFVNITCTFIGKKLAFGQFSNWFIQCSWFCKDECSYDVHKFQKSSSFPHASLLFCFEMRIFFWLLYLNLCTY